MLLELEIEPYGKDCIGPRQQAVPYSFSFATSTPPRIILEIPYLDELEDVQSACVGLY